LLYVSKLKMQGSAEIIGDYKIDDLFEDFSADVHVIPNCLNTWQNPTSKKRKYYCLKSLHITTSPCIIILLYNCYPLFIALFRLSLKKSPS
jgi:hypothetical protein